MVYKKGIVFTLMSNSLDFVGKIAKWASIVDPSTTRWSALTSKALSFFVKYHQSEMKIFEFDGSAETPR